MNAPYHRDRPAAGPSSDFTAPTSIGARVTRLKPRPNGYKDNHSFGLSQHPQRRPTTGQSAGAGSAAASETQTSSTSLRA